MATVGRMHAMLQYRTHIDRPTSVYHYAPYSVSLVIVIINITYLIQLGKNKHLTMFMSSGSVGLQYGLYRTS